MKNYRLWLFTLFSMLVLFIISGVNVIATRQQTVTSSLGNVVYQYYRRAEHIVPLMEILKDHEFNQALLDRLQTAYDKAIQMNPKQTLLDRPETIAPFEDLQNQVTDALIAVANVALTDPQINGDSKFQAAYNTIRIAQRRIIEGHERLTRRVNDFNATIVNFPGLFWARIYDSKPKADFSPEFTTRKLPAPND